MKKIFLLLTLSTIMTGCVNKVNTSTSNSTITDSTTNIDTGSDIDTSDTNTSISISDESQADVTHWDELKPYLEYALGNYANYLPSISVHKYHVSFQVQESIVAVQIDCLEISGDAETSYSSILNRNDFHVVNDEVPYAYKMVSTFDCLYATYLQNDSTFSILAYYRQVRVADFPQEVCDLVTGHKFPNPNADAYWYGSPSVNSRNFVSFSVDCFYNDGTNSLNNWLKTLSKAGYEYTNQQGYYTAYSSDGEVVINFDDYYGDGTCIELTMYSTWCSIDYINYFGFDLPRYSGEYTNWETQFISLESGNYICVYYDGVDSNCLTTYGAQLLSKGLTYSSSESSPTNAIYYLDQHDGDTLDDPYVQIAYQASSHTMVIAVPFVDEYYE